MLIFGFCLSASHPGYHAKAHPELSPFFNMILSVALSSWGLTLDLTVCTTMPDTTLDFESSVDPLFFFKAGFFCVVLAILELILYIKQTGLELIGIFLPLSPEC